ncbi:MAG: hypothetical protein ACREIB_04480, partial [Pseudomonadota bacterium]
MAEKRPARPLVNGAACFGRRIRQARDGLGEQRVIVSHVVLRAFERPSVNPASELCPSIAEGIVNEDCVGTLRAGRKKRDRGLD